MPDAEEAPRHDLRGHLGQALNILDRGRGAPTAGYRSWPGSGCVSRRAARSAGSRRTMPCPAIWSGSVSEAVATNASASARVAQRCWRRCPLV